METLNNPAGKLTERIMRRLASPFNPDSILKDADTATYNKLYSAVYAELNEAKDLDMSIRLSHGEPCLLSRLFNQAADLRRGTDRKINEWLMEQIAAAKKAA